MQVNFTSPRPSDTPLLRRRGVGGEVYVLYEAGVIFDICRPAAV